MIFVDGRVAVGVGAHTVDVAVGIWGIEVPVAGPAGVSGVGKAIVAVDALEEHARKGLGRGERAIGRRRGFPDEGLEHAALRMPRDDGSRQRGREDKNQAVP